MQSMNSKILSVLLLLLSTSINAQNISYREIVTRENVKQPFLYLKINPSTAVVILFQGGNGVIGASGSAEKGWARNDNAFLSGGAKRFADNGVTVVVMDKPSDKSDLNNFRNSIEHNKDVQAVITFLKKDNPNVPIWLVGTSNGSLSASSSASNLGKEFVDGIVLTASASVPHTISFAKKFVHVFTDAKLDQIEVPVLFVHHLSDKCTYTPYQPIPDLMKLFTKSPKVELISIEGGKDDSRVCDSGFHQFLGQEAEVTKQIVDWIKLNK